MPELLAYSALYQPRNLLSAIAVIDFETTGLSPAQGDRATEIAIVVLDGATVVDRFHSLMNAGVRISPFIEAYTGISNEMILAAPPASEVMAQAMRFVGDMPMVAHNASFDQRFWTAEITRLGGPSRSDRPLACTLLLSRRLYPGAGSYQLGSMAAFHGIAPAGRAHRAMADAQVAAGLLSRIQADIRERYAVDTAPHALLLKMQSTPRKDLHKAVERYRQSVRGD